MKHKLLLPILIFFGLIFSFSVQAATSPRGCETDTMKGGVFCNWTELKSWCNNNTNTCEVESTTDCPTNPANGSYSFSCNINGCVLACNANYLICGGASCVYNDPALHCATLNNSNCTAGECATCVVNYSLCAAAHTCVATQTCLPGQTFDACTASCVGFAGLKLGSDSLNPSNFVIQSPTSSVLYIPSSGFVGIGTSTPAAKLEVISSSGNTSILAGLKRIGNVDLPFDIADAATKGYVDSLVSTATGSITTLWGGTTSGNIWSLNSGFVGIGTTTPGYKLDVVGGVNTAFGYGYSINTNQVLQQVGGTVKAGLIAYAHMEGVNTNTLNFLTNNAVRMTIAPTTGNVGIGTTTPGAKLDVKVGNSIGNTEITRIGESTYGYLSISRNVLSGFVSPTGIQFSIVNPFPGYENNVTPLTLLDNGYVGIGTTSPGSVLHIVGSDPMITINDTDDVLRSVKIGIVTAGDEYPGVWLGQSSPSTFNYSFLGGGTYSLFNAPSGGYVDFRIGNASKMRINTSSGDVGIGTTTPAAKLEVISASGNSSILAGLKRIGNVDLPFDITDAATKGYVDSTIDAATSSLQAIPKFVGMTTNTYSGDNGGTAGYAYAHAQCAAAYAGSHVCASYEILNTLVAGGTMPPEDGWIFSGPPAYTALANDCDARTSATSATYGTYWQKIATGYPEGRGLLIQCNNVLRFACCK